MAVSKYLFAVNSDLKLSRASLTQPSILKYYKKKGNDEFAKYFVKENFFWSDAVLSKIVIKDNLIQVQLKLALKKDEFASPEIKRILIYALSEDNGSSWFFVEDKEYRTQNCGDFQRLIK
jgi:hypothetical protein